MNVFTTATSGSRHVHVHLTADCRGLVGGQRSGGTPREVREVPLEDVELPEPCLWCFPDVPRAKIWRPLCGTCEQTRVLPCPHNGGVLVVSTRRGQWTGVIGKSVYDPDKVVSRNVYVWPENAYRYALAQT